MPWDRPPLSHQHWCLAQGLLNALTQLMPLLYGLFLRKKLASSALPPELTSNSSESSWAVGSASAFRSPPRVTQHILSVLDYIHGQSEGLMEDRQFCFPSGAADCFRMPHWMTLTPLATVTTLRPPPHWGTRNEPEEHQMQPKLPLRAVFQSLRLSVLHLPPQSGRGNRGGGEAEGRLESKCSLFLHPVHKQGHEKEKMVLTNNMPFPFSLGSRIKMYFCTLVLLLIIPE